MSSYSEGQTHQLMEALESAGYSATEVTKFGQLGEEHSKIRLFLAGKATIVEEVAEKVRGVVKRILNSFLTIKTEPTTKEQLVADIKANKNDNNVPDEVTDYAVSMTDHDLFTLSQEVEDVSFVILSVAELGFTEQPKTTDFMTEEFCRKWSVENLNGQAIELCMPDDGPRIWKVWLDQPKDTTVWCAMNRIPDSDCDPRVWSVVRHDRGRRYLSGSWVDSDSLWFLGRRLVFRLRKVSTA